MIKTLRRKPNLVAGALLLCLLPPVAATQAQQSASPPAPPAAPIDVDKNDPADQVQIKPQNDRIFWALPNFLTVENATNVPPLTAGQKFKIELRSTFDPVEYPYVGIVALINQASNSDPSYGQGFKGYAKRYGSAFADNTVGNVMTGAVFPALLRQDPRYYQLGKGSFLRRTGHAITRCLVTRSDAGEKQFNYSEILGNATAGALSNLYHPAPHTLGNSISIWWTQIGWDAASYELKEFWPDLKHKLHK